MAEAAAASLLAEEDSAKKARSQASTEKQRQKQRKQVRSLQSALLSLAGGG